MLPQDMKRCSVCTLRKTDRHFIRKERIFKTCNKCSEYGKSRRRLTNKVNKVKQIDVSVQTKPQRIISRSLKLIGHRYD